MKIQPRQAIAVEGKAPQALPVEGATRAPVMSASKRNSVLAVFVLLFVFILSFVTNIHTANSIPLCFFKYLTHLDCPGCGLARSFISLSHGHFLQALQFNILGPFVYLYFLLYLVRHLLNLFLRNGFMLNFQLPPWSGLLLIGLLFTQWIYKVGSHFFQHFIS